MKCKITLLPRAAKPSVSFFFNSSSRSNTQTPAIVVTNTTATSTATPAEWLHTDSRRTTVGVDIDLEKVEWSSRNNVDENGGQWQNEK
ncbi:hypothetical protein C5167_000303 [Papaver somniferum]|uniref:Uncharacterized protein n=1 Tax=Papaver somniferum TaxID=3469 RepID=A0A4Y7KS20_PAPSO|nr:hypothetical protein C5167_000303 [Papaver somniferum]